VWQPLVVAEHQIAHITLGGDAPAVQREVRWSTTQEVRLMRAASFLAFLKSLEGRSTMRPTGDTAPLGDSADGYLDQSVRTLFEALGPLPDDLLVVEASAHHVVRVAPLAPARPTALQFLPAGCQRAVLSSPADYGPTDALDPAWLLIGMPFLGRLQAEQHDGLKEAGAAGARPFGVDPVLGIARLRAAQPRQPLPSLALALAHFSDDAPRTVTISPADAAAARTFGRLDPTALEEAWFRVVHPLPEVTGPQARFEGVAAALPDTLARPSRSMALRQAFDPLRPSYLPAQPHEPPPEPLFAAAPVWRENALWVLQAVSRAPQGTARAWLAAGLQILSSSLMPAPNAGRIGDGVKKARYAAATVLPVQPPAADAIYPGQVLAVSPYLALDWQPAGARELKILIAELLCLDTQTRVLRTLTTQLYPVAAGGGDAVRARVAAWAVEAHARLAPESPVAVIRYREINDNPHAAEAAGGEAPLTVTYGFSLVAVATPQPLARRLFAVRAKTPALRYREGQCGINAIPEEAHDFEIAPPQTAGIQPLWLPERPAVANGEPGRDFTAPAPWPWGLSAVRVSVRYTDKAAGVTGPAAAPDAELTLWWQAVSQRVQFRSSLNSPRPVAGLPAHFRAPAIKSLLPAPPVLPLPRLDSKDIVGDGRFGWQAILPGAVRYLIVGGRPGVFFTLRHSLIRQSGMVADAQRRPGSLVSGGIPAMVRMPRPVPLPLNDPVRRSSALQTWAGWFDAQANSLVTAGPADEAFFLSASDEAPQRLQLRLLRPMQGRLDPNGDGVLSFIVLSQAGTTPIGWTVLVELAAGAGVCPYVTGGGAGPDGSLTFRPEKPDAFKQVMLQVSHGDEIHVRVRARLSAAIDNYYQLLTFTLRVGDPSSPALPLVPTFVHFEDPEYNRRLASLPARVVSFVQLPSGAASRQYDIVLAADRRECNPTSTLYLLYHWDGDIPVPNPNADLRLARVDRDGVPHPFSFPGVPPNPWAPDALVELALAKAMAGGIRLEPGDRLLSTLRIAGKEITLAVNVVAAPVTPVPEAAYALLCKGGTPEAPAVSCVRFAWGPSAEHVDIVRPADLTGELVRRRAVFHLSDVQRAGQVQGYAVQKITTSGSTHVPTEFVAPAPGDPQGSEGGAP
jgi:hypothetical protein